MLNGSFKYFFLVLFFILSTADHVSGQEVLNKHYLVYLNDGSFLKGTIIAADKTSIRLQLLNEETIVIKRSSIKIIKPKRAEQKLIKEGILIKNAGFYNVFSSSLLFGKPDEDSEEPKIGWSSISFSKGYQWSPYIGIGGGFSLDVYDHIYLPLFFDFRGYLFENKVSISYNLKAGYAVARDQVFPNDDSQTILGGILAHPSIGIRISSHSSTSTLLEVGYRFQYSRRTYRWSRGVEKFIYKRLAIRLGFLF